MIIGFTKYFVQKAKGCVQAQNNNMGLFCFVLFFVSVFLTGCQTTKAAKPSGEAGLSESGGKPADSYNNQEFDDFEEEDVAEAIGEGEEDDTPPPTPKTTVDSSADDLEKEFIDSEDFEEEMVESAPSPSDSSDQTAKAAPPAAAEEPSLESSEPAEVSAGGLVDSSVSAVEGAAPVVINSIRYQAGENKIYIEGEGNLSYQSRENTAENQLVIEIPNAILADNLKYPFVMKDFDTQMALLQADQKDNNIVRIVVQARQNASLPVAAVSESGGLVIGPGGQPVEGGGGGDIVQTDGMSLMEGVDGSSITGGGGVGSGVLPAKSLEEFFLQTPKFQGRPMSVHLQDVDVRDVLYFISEGTGLNMVVAEDVTGKISVKLRKVPWDQVLVTILKAKKLGYLREGNVIRIMTLNSLKENQKAIQEMVQNQRVLEPMKVKVIPVVYAEADQFKKQIDLFLSKGYKGAHGGGEVGKGQAIVDTNTNSIIITDTARVIAQIEELIKNLDRSPTQVMIEAKIVEARRTFVRNLGIGWVFTGEPLNMNIGGNPRLALNITGGIDAFPTLFGQSGGGRTIKTRNLSFSFAPVGRLEAILDLSEANNTVQVLSSPRVMVLNGEEATIRQSTETIDVATQAAAGGQAVGTSARRNPVVLSLKVKPKITAVGTVFMEITMQRDFPGPIVDPGTGARPVNSRTASTKVLVNNGQTLVIGGIYQKDETRGDEGLPILKHIPVIKWLFNRFSSDESRNELLLFLTPHVMDFKAAQASNL